MASLYPSHKKILPRREGDSADLRPHRPLLLQVAGLLGRRARLQDPKIISACHRGGEQMRPAEPRGEPPGHQELAE